MKRICLIACCLLPAVLMAQGNFNINANVKALKNGDKIYLFYQVDGQTKTDSAIVQGGGFQFAGKVPQPSQATICLNKNLLVNRAAKGEVVDMFRFYVEPGKLNLNAVDSLKHIAVTGSKINEENKVWQALRKPADDKLTALDKELAMQTDSQKNDENFLKGLIAREK